jgi:predicted DNA-binding protein with PD1-like motif
VALSPVSIRPNSEGTPLLLVYVGRGEEVITTIKAKADELKIRNASISLIGAVGEAEISVMKKDDPKTDYIRRYTQPMEVHGTGEIESGYVHLHVTLGGEDLTVAGHLHSAVVHDFFIRAYIQPLD